MNKRLAWVDAVKVFAISLVILGHCIQYLWSGSPNIIFNYIYSFHMPLFMCISGFLSYKENIPFLSIKKRFKQLIIPFMCWPIIVMLVRGDIYKFVDTYTKILYHPDTGLWFLYALFFISLIMFGINHLCNYFNNNILHDLEGVVVVVVALLLNAILYFTDFKLFGFKFISWYFIFYSLGFFMKKYWDITSKFLQYSGVPAIIIYLVGGGFWNGEGAPTFYEYINLGNLFVYVYKLIISVAGILATFYVCINFVCTNLHKSITYIGTNTLGIYAIHVSLGGIVYNWIRTMNINDVSRVSIAFILLYAISLLIVYLFSKSRFLSFLFLGK